MSGWWTIADEMMGERTFFWGGPGKNIHGGDGNVWVVAARGWRTERRTGGRCSSRGCSEPERRYVHTRMLCSSHVTISGLEYFCLGGRPATADKSYSCMISH